MASKLTTFTARVSKALGNGFDAEDIRDIIKSRKLLGSNIDNASKVVKETIENRKAITNAFNDAIEIGGSKKMYVGKDSNILKRYEHHTVGKNRKRDVGLQRALEDVRKKPKIKKPTADEATEAAIKKLKEKENLELKAKRKQQVRDIDQQRNAQFNVKPKEKPKTETEPKTKEKPKTEPKEKSKIENKTETDGLNGKRPEAKTSEQDVSFDSKKLKEKMSDSKTDYMRHKAAKEHDEALKIFDLKEKNLEKFEEKARNNPIFNKLKGDGDNYGGITKEQLEKARIEAILGASEDQMGLTDYMGYHKIPQKVTGGVGTFWLVNKLASSNGQQTNAQLYGQQPY